jgi:hypothetical protein
MRRRSDQAPNMTTMVERPGHPNTMNADKMHLLKIILPNDSHTIVTIQDETTTGQMLLPTLRHKHRLDIGEYILKVVQETDRSRLMDVYSGGLVSEEIDLDRPLKPLMMLGLQEVALMPKLYADAPKVVPNVGGTVSTFDGSHQGSLRTSLSIHQSLYIYQYHFTYRCLYRFIDLLIYIYI